MADGGINPWVRAEMEQFSHATLALVRPGDQFEYVAGMRNLAHWKAVMVAAMEQLNAAEEWRHDFFDRQIGNVVQLRLVEVDSPPEAA